MFACCFHFSVIGSNVKIVLSPSRRPTVPPITSTVPSSRNDWPAQKMLAGSSSPPGIFGGYTAFVAWVTGSSRKARPAVVPVKYRIFPVWSITAWTATPGIENLGVPLPDVGGRRGDRGRRPGRVIRRGLRSRRATAAPAPALPRARPRGQGRAPAPRRRAAPAPLQASSRRPACGGAWRRRCRCRRAPGRAPAPRQRQAPPGMPAIRSCLTPDALEQTLSRARSEQRADAARAHRLGCRPACPRSARPTQMPPTRAPSSNGAPAPARQPAGGASPGSPTW